jgi:low affinity Fe/Cu permease
MKGRVSVSRECREDFIFIEELAKRSIDQAIQKEEERRGQDVANAIRVAKELAEAQQQREMDAKQQAAVAVPSAKRSTAGGRSRGPSQQLLARGGRSK